MLMIFVLLVLAGFAVHVMSPAERTRVLRSGLKAVFQLKDAAIKYHQERDPFHDALGARTRWVLVTPALTAINVFVFLRLLFGDGSLGDPATLVGWGASVGPRTTNGEWWRLVTMAFVHAGLLQLLVNMAALVQVGLILERMVGHVTVATIYFAAALLAGVVSLSADPLAVSIGASGAVFGLYGLLFASTIWGLFPRSEMTIPLLTLKRLGPVAGVFVLYNVVNGGLESGGELAGLGVGFVGGLALTWDVSVRKPAPRRLASAMAAALVLTVAFAVPLRGVADVKPEIQRLLALEERTARAYQKSLAQFRLGAIKAEGLAEIINRTILPELRAARARVKAIDGVPPEHRPLVAAADEYLRLRDESWRLRAEGLIAHSMPALESADSAERASLDAFARLR
jgi:rhomboid protease GluP